MNRESVRRLLGETGATTLQPDSRIRSVIEETFCPVTDDSVRCFL